MKGVETQDVKRGSFSRLAWKTLKWGTEIGRLILEISEKDMGLYALFS